MRRLYFLVPDIPSGKKVVDELLLARIEWKHIHVIAKRGTPLEDMPEASHWQKSDVVPALQRAIPVGGATGLLCGLVGLALERTDASPVCARMCATELRCHGGGTRRPRPAYRR